jgi:hypothetical protein
LVCAGKILDDHDRELDGCGAVDVGAALDVTLVCAGKILDDHDREVDDCACDDVCSLTLICNNDTTSYR